MNAQVVRSNLRTLFARLGWDVRRVASAERIRKERSTRLQCEKWSLVSRYSPKTILDIGANTGQFARLIREVVPDARIISFEPLKTCYEKLESQKEELAPIDILHTALGATSSTATMNHNTFSPSSSLLEMEKLHVDELPQTAEVRPEEVTVQKLDEIAPSLSIERPFVVKIDVQGFEEQVLLGGEQTLKSATAVVAEISSYPLYRGEASFDRIYQLMRDRGFVYRGNVDQWTSRRDGRILQFDALFENEILIDNSVDMNELTVRNENS